MAKRRSVTRAEQVAAILATQETQQRRPSKSKDNILNFNNYVQEARERSKVTITPKSPKQSEYVDYLLDPEKLIVFATGPAGTGKTMLAVQAAIKAFKAGEVQKIVITRPAVGVDDEKFGFLPGDINEKMAPWARPIFDVFKEYYKPRDISAMINDEVIELSPLAYMRGRTFKEAFIIADEMQGSSTNQMKMLLTRLGDKSKMVITGDLQQNDRKMIKDNGLRDFISLLNSKYSSTMVAVDFDNEDIQRHPVVQEVLEMYGEI